MFDHKTWRNPGQFQKFRILMLLGLPDETCWLGAVTVLNASRSKQLRFDLQDRFDELTGFTAMEGRSALSGAAALQLHVKGEAAGGSSAPEHALLP